MNSGQAIHSVLQDDSSYTPTVDDPEGTRETEVSEIGKQKY